MILIAIVGSLFAVATIAYWWGAWKLAQYGFRISTGTGIAVLLIPPYTFMFAMKLQESGKELPMASWLFGIVSSLLLTGIFFQPLTMIATGRIGEMAEKSTKNSIEEKQVPKVEKKIEVKPVEAPKVEPPTTVIPTPGTPEGTPTDGTPKADPAAAPVVVDPTKVVPPTTEAPKVDEKPVEKTADAPK